MEKYLYLWIFLAVMQICLAQVKRPSSVLGSGGKFGVLPKPKPPSPPGGAPQGGLVSGGSGGPQRPRAEDEGVGKRPSTFTKDSTCSPVTQRYLADIENRCKYYECTARGTYSHMDCPRNIGVRNTYMQGARKGIPYSHPICKKFTSKCAKRDLLNAIHGNFVVKKVKRCGIDLLWVIDISCSITMDDKIKVRNFVHNTIDRFQINGHNFVQTGGLCYDGKLHKIMYLSETRNKPATMYKFDHMQMKPSKCHTATNLALREICDVYLNEGNRPEFPDILIVVTDGKTHLGRKGDNKAARLETVQYAECIRNKNVMVFVVGLPVRKSGSFQGHDEWKAIAGNENNIFLITNFDELGRKVDVIANSTCPE